MSHLIAAHTKVDAESRINEHTALTYCADTDNATAMIHLVKKCGASVDNETSAHETALTVALKSEKWRKVTDALMNNLNASATLETSAGDSAVSVAFDSDDEDKILKVLRDGKVGREQVSVHDRGRDHVRHVRQTKLCSSHLDDF